MKLQEVTLKARAKKLTLAEAAEIAGMSVRNMRRMRERNQKHGHNGLFDQRRGKSSDHGVALETAEEVLALYRQLLTYAAGLDAAVIVWISPQIREEHDNRIQKLPVEPDAVFSLGLPPDRLSHFCYEAERGTMPIADMLKKLRAYFHFIKRRQNHKEAFGLHPIRAVLIETTDESRARKLMGVLESPSVIGAGKRHLCSGLPSLPYSLHP
ncbi:MAG TPA: hypothetical protein VGN17_14475 [Bryobacteraceae bacterium]